MNETNTVEEGAPQKMSKMEIAAARANMMNWLQMDVGDEFIMHGVRCKIGNLNQGKRRITLVPVDPEVPMPAGRKDGVFNIKSAEEEQEEQKAKLGKVRFETSDLPAPVEEGEVSKSSEESGAAQDGSL